MKRWQKDLTWLTLVMGALALLEAFFPLKNNQEEIQEVKEQLTLLTKKLEAKEQTTENIIEKKGVNKIE